MTCPVCGNAVTERRKTYCSVRCRRFAEEARRRQKAAWRFEEVEVGEVATREQLLALLTVAARAGHVGAMKVLIEELRRDDPKASADFIDELARKRENEG
jgi:hypothetical protein